MAADLLVNLDQITKVFYRKPLPLPWRKGQQHAPPVTVLKDVTFGVPAGHIYGMLGPSGCGKTTTIRMMCGAYTPTSGAVEVFGQPPYQWSRREQARIGYVPQLFVLYPNLTVRQNLNFMASVYGVLPNDARKRIGQVLDLVELDKAVNTPAGNISGGMQRRLMLAAALLHQPELMFIDEPTAGIDPILRAKLWDHFKALRDQGVTLFVTTQYVNEADLCDFVGIMSRGELIANGTPSDLRNQAFAGESQVIDVTAAADLPKLLTHLEGLPEVKNVERQSARRLLVRVGSAGQDMEEVVEGLRQDGVAIESVSAREVSFDDVFLRLVKQAGRPTHAMGAAGGAA